MSTGYKTFFLISGTIGDDIRQPRVSGRIVKLYSGHRPEPIYCSGEGFQLDPSNCAVFYRCVKSSTQKFTVFRVSNDYSKGLDTYCSAINF